MNKENFKQLIVNDSIISESENSVVMSENDVFKLVSAFNEWLKNNVVREETNISVSVGTDASGISDETKVTVFKSLSYNKTEIFDCGKTFVPALFKSIANLNTTGAIYISSVSADSEKYKIEFKYTMDKSVKKITHPNFNFFDNLNQSQKNILLGLFINELFFDSNFSEFNKRISKGEGVEIKEYSNNNENQIIITIENKNRKPLRLKKV